MPADDPSRLIGPGNERSARRRRRFGRRETRSGFVLVSAFRGRRLRRHQAGWPALLIGVPVIFAGLAWLAGLAPLVGGSLVGVLAVVTAVGALFARRRGRRAHEPDDVADVRGAVYAAAAAGVDAMRDVADPRAAIVACYAAMERVLANAGVGRRMAETPSELLTNAAELGHAPQAARQLAELFADARYSAHPMTHAEREMARAALAQLREPVGLVNRSGS